MLYSNINPEKTYWMGADGFTWWVGQVQADGGKKLNKDGTFSTYVDKSASNRVKVRIIGYHTSKHEELPVEDLPWAQVMMPANLPQSSGYGGAHQLALGTWVIGFFLDGLNCQQPIVMGVIGNIDTGTDTKFKPGQILTDNPEQPGFNNILHPLYRASAAAGGVSTSSAPANTGTSIPFTEGGYCPVGQSPEDKRTDEDKQKQISVASPCGTETQEKIDQTLGDLFRFLKSIKKVNDQYVKKYTGEVVDFVGKINGFIGRLINVVSDILGSIKTLIINEIKKLVRSILLPLIQPFLPELTSAANELSQQLLNLLICLVDNILKSIIQFLENLIFSLIENVVNAAFCLVQAVVNSILSAITSAVSGVLSVIQNVVSLIGQGGDLIANLASNLADFIGSLCAGFDCQTDTSRYDMKTGDFQPRSLFGSSDAIINTDFLNNVDAPKIFDENGNLIQGSLNCSQDNLTFFSCPPRIALLGLNGDAGAPVILPVVDNLGRIISTIIGNPGNNILTNPTAIITSCNGYGNGAQITPIIRNGQVVDAIINNPGSGYPYFDRNFDNTGNLSGGSISNGNIVNGTIANAIIENPVISNGNITGGTILNGNLSNSSFSIDNRNPITLNSGNINSGNINSGTITNITPISGTNNIQATITNASISNANINNAVFPSVISSNSPNYIGVLTGFTVTNVGSGYNENTQILLNGQNAGSPVISNTGNITNVISSLNGEILNSYPDIQIIGNGTGAKIVPIIKFAPREQAQTLAYQYNIPIEKIDCPGHPQGN